MRKIARDFLQHGSCNACLAWHADILTDLQTQLTDEHAIKSHFFHGRFENIYIAAENIRGLDRLLGFLQQQAADILAVDARQLQLGFWFNIMHKGDVTTLHSHDDNDELLSGTYYLQMPRGSGRLLLHHEHIMTIEPVTGDYAFFHPAVEHEVTTHQASEPRISLGFNLGLRESKS